MMPQQRIGGPFRHLQQEPFFGTYFHIQHQLEHPQCPRQWRPDLVAHICQEFAFCHTCRLGGVFGDGQFFLGLLQRRFDLLSLLDFRLQLFVDSDQIGRPLLDSPFKMLLLGPDLCLCLQFGVDLRHELRVKPSTSSLALFRLSIISRF